MVPTPPPRADRRRKAPDTHPSTARNRHEIPVKNRPRKTYKMEQFGTFHALNSNGAKCVIFLTYVKCNVNYLLNIVLTLFVLW